MTADSGWELARAVDERPDGDDVTTSARMILREQDREPRIRQFHTFRIDTDDDAGSTLIRFTEPSDIRGTGLLIHDHPDGDADQWLYLPALDRVRRIASGRRGGRFVGSDLYYEDLQNRTVDMDHHELLGSEEISGVSTTVLESTPVDPSNSVYTKRRRWIHEDTLVALRIDFYEGDGTPSKRLEVKQLERIQGYWTVMDSVMTDLDSGHTTRIRVDSIEYDRDLPEALFSERTLADPGRDARQRLSIN